MTRFSWIYALTVVAFLVTPVVADAALDVFPVRRYESLSADADEPGSWQARLLYAPNQSWVRLSLTQTDRYHWPPTSLRVESTEPWVPSWESQTSGSIGAGDLVSYELVTPEPMNVERARLLLASLRLVLRAEGREEIERFAAPHTLVPLDEPSYRPLGWRWFGWFDDRKIRWVY